MELRTFVAKFFVFVCLFVLDEKTIVEREEDDIPSESPMVDYTSIP